MARPGELKGDDMNEERYIAKRLDWFSINVVAGDESGVGELVLDHLPDIDELEDLALDDLPEFVAVYVWVMGALDRLSVSITEYSAETLLPLPYFAAQEEQYERWLEAAQDYLPEWAYAVVGNKGKS